MNPRSYEDIKALAEATGSNIADLIVLARNNDPFFCGTPAHRRDAEWFVRCWRQLGCEALSGVHLRAIHYKLVSQDPPPITPSGKPYINTLECWSYLGAASKAARHLRLVDAETFEDHRNPDPIIHARRLEASDPAMDADYWEGWALPEIHADLADDFELPLPAFTAVRLRLRSSPATVPPGNLDREIHAARGAVAVVSRASRQPGSSIGFQSIPSTIALLRRAQAHGKPTRVFYLSDFDPAGSFMPDAVARQLECWRHRLDIRVEVKLQPLALTKEQVIEYRLPSIPIKETDRRKAGFESRYGMEATEIDALEALRPGVLARLVEEAIEPYRDLDLCARWKEAAAEAKSVAKEAEAWVACEQQVECHAIQVEVRTILESYRDRIAALNDALQQELNPYRDRVSAVRQAIQDAIDIVPDVFELPEQPEPDLAEPDDSGWLFDSGRSYLTQLAVYKERRNEESERQTA